MTEPFDVLLIDPPWHFKVYNADKSDRHASHKYDLMSSEAICELPVEELAAENCALFVWATWPNLLEAIRAIEAWGARAAVDGEPITYRTLAWVWVKSNPSGFGFHLGMGYYTRANSEPCLLAVRGQMPVQAHDVLALIHSPVREHSRKPDEQYGKIERLYPGARKCELFARRKREGWSSWGNEIDPDITFAGLEAA